MEPTTTQQSTATGSDHLRGRSHQTGTPDHRAQDHRAQDHRAGSGPRRTSAGWTGVANPNRVRVDNDGRPRITDRRHG